MALKQMVLAVELLYDSEITPDPSNWSLADIENEFTNGSMSARVYVQSEKTLGKHQMAKALIRQGSDPEFLLHEGDYNEL